MGIEEEEEFGEEGVLGVGGIGVDKMEGLTEFFDGQKDIVAEEFALGSDIESFDVASDAAAGFWVCFDEGDVGSAPAESFEAHGARSCVEIEDVGSFDGVLEDIKDRLPHHG